MLDTIKKFVPNRLKKGVKLILHRGDTYACPLCGYSSKDLAPIGADAPILKEKQIVGGGRRFAGCYSCGSSDRERLIYLYLRDDLKIFTPDKNKSILHIAPEESLTNRLLQFGFKQYVCGDLFTEGYKYPAHVENINALDIPYDDNTFDLIICNHVLEHIEPDILAMQELRRVLNVGGKAILQIPISKNTAKTIEDFSITDPKERIKIFGQYDHCRIYGQDYEDRLAESGFKVIRTNISRRYPKNGVNLDEDIFIGEK